MVKKGECYKDNIPRKEAKKRNALINLFPAYQIYHGFKKISKGNYKHDRQVLRLTSGLKRRGMITILHTSGKKCSWWAVVVEVDYWLER